MTKNARQRELSESLEATLREQDGAERYQGAQRQVRREGQETVRGRKEVDLPRPLEFDANGFPVAQRSSSFVTRVARLLGA